MLFDIDTVSTLSIEEMIAKENTKKINIRIKSEIKKPSIEAKVNLKNCFIRFPDKIIILMSIKLIKNIAYFNSRIIQIKNIAGRYEC